MLQRADIMAHSEFGKSRIKLLDDRILLMKDIIAAEECFKIKDLKVNGRDLIELGVPEGPGVGVMLDELFEKVINGELQNEREALLLYIGSRL